MRQRRTDMRQRKTGYPFVDEKALHRDILAKIGSELRSRYDVPQELPRELLAFIMQIMKTANCKIDRVP